MLNLGNTIHMDNTPVHRLRASDIMKTNLEWLNPTPTVGRVVDVLRRTKHSAFPVCVYT